MSKDPEQDTGSPHEHDPQPYAGSKRPEGDRSPDASAADEDRPPKKARLDLSGDPNLQPPQGANTAHAGGHGHSSTPFTKLAMAKATSREWSEEEWAQGRNSGLNPAKQGDGGDAEARRLAGQALGEGGSNGDENWNAGNPQSAARDPQQNSPDDEDAEASKDGGAPDSPSARQVSEGEQPGGHGHPENSHDAAVAALMQQQRAGQQMMWARAHWDALSAAAAREGGDGSKEGSAGEHSGQERATQRPHPAGFAPGDRNEGSTALRPGLPMLTAPPGSSPAGSQSEGPHMHPQPGGPPRAGQPMRPPWNPQDFQMVARGDPNSREQMGYYEQMMAHQEFMAQHMGGQGPGGNARPPHFWQMSPEQVAAMQMQGLNPQQHAEMVAQQQAAAARSGGGQRSGPQGQPMGHPQGPPMVYVGNPADLQRQPPIQTTAPVPGDFPVIPVAAYHINQPGAPASAGGNTGVQQFSNALPAAVIDDSYMPPMNSMSYRLELRPEELTTQSRDTKSTFSLVGESTTSRRYQFRCPDHECPHSKEVVTTPWLMSTSNKFRCPSAHCKAKKQKNNHTIPAHVMRIHLIDVRMARSLGY